MKFLRLGLDFIKDIFRNKSVIYQLTKRDYKNKYIGSLLGFAWTIIQPIVMILVLWLVFAKGFNAGPVRGIPFIAWLAIGIIAWDFFAVSLASLTGVFQEYSYLVKKINFRIAILPFVKLFSSLITHVIFIGIGIGILLFSGAPVSFYWFQVIYYLIALMAFLLGLSWIVSSLQVFVRDVSQVVAVVLQFLFWGTPIVWDFALVPEAYQFWFKLNPVFYIVEGYRKTFLFNEPFWVDYEWAIYFWSFTFVVIFFGVILFKRLRPHFSDVL